jgi:hypothetical protein
MAIQTGSNGGKVFAIADRFASQSRFLKRIAGDSGTQRGKGTGGGTDERRTGAEGYQMFGHF